MGNPLLKKYWELCRTVRESGKFVQDVAIHKSGTDTMVIIGNIVIVDGSDTIQEWLSNFRFATTGRNDVHAGFAKAADCFFEQIKPILYKRGDWIFCGHSRGGAIVQALALRCAQVGANAQVVTFGSPKVGGKTFRTRMEANRVVHVRVEMVGDSVPKWPLWLKHYETDFVPVANNEKTAKEKHLNYGEWL